MCKIKGKLQKEEGDFLKVKDIDLEIIYKIRKSKATIVGNIVEFNKDDVEKSQDRGIIFPPPPPPTNTSNDISDSNDTLKKK